MRWSRSAVVAWVTITCFSADQIAKLLVRAALPLCQEFPLRDCARVHVGPLDVVSVRNRGTGFAFARDPTLAAGLGLLACILIVAYLAWARRSTWIAALGAALQAGGALSNLLDRLFLGGASDYLNVTPTFTYNLADVFLLVGTALAVVAVAARPARPARRRPSRAPARGPAVPSPPGAGSEV